jgi:dihydrofolate synthase/folylpolyglutamate synthase
MPDPSLDRIQALAEALDHPELTYPTIQVTGTNGKTTTARMVTAVACAHGLSTGTFVSPHVESVTERISVCGRAIADQEFGDEYGRLLPYLERVDALDHPATYFEALTALAYLWFADKPVELGVFEVGMGGTWDATNLVRGDVAVLCPIGLDHPELGSTVAEVATEKAGIVKEGNTAVVREQRPEARRVIERRCEEVRATLLLEGRDFAMADRAPAVGGQVIAVRGLHASYEGVFLPLFGEQLARNAALSVVAVESLLGRSLDQAAVAASLGAVTSPGRLEVVGRRPLVVLDGAHNPDAAGALALALTESFTWERLHLVLGMFVDKDVEAVCRLVAPLAARGYACRSSSPRAAPTDRIESALKEAGLSDVSSFDSVEEAIDAARSEAAAGDLILVTGSFYTVAEGRPLFVPS